MINIKSDKEINLMRASGKLASEVLNYITPFVKSGTSTLEIDTLCHDYIVNEQKTIPAPLNYCPPGHTPYPNSICTSVNNVICHGIPNEKKLKDGDILNIDVTVIKDGFHGDTSRMFFIGKPNILAKRLVDTTFECMWKGIEVVKPGAQLGDIGAAIQEHA